MHRHKRVILGAAAAKDLPSTLHLYKNYRAQLQSLPVENTAIP